MDIAAVQTFVSTTLVDVALKVLGAIVFWVVGRWIIHRVVLVMQGSDGAQRCRSDAHQVPRLDRRHHARTSCSCRDPRLLRVETTSFAAVSPRRRRHRRGLERTARQLRRRRVPRGPAAVQGRRLRHRRRRHGTVNEIGLFGTTINTPDNVRTIVGNNKIFSDTIQNFSVIPYRRVDRQAQLADGVDTRDAIERLRNAVLAIPNVVADPPPQVSLLDLKSDGPPSRCGRTPRTRTTRRCMRHQRGDHPRRPGGRLARADAGADHARRAGLMDGRPRLPGRRAQTTVCASSPCA